MEFTQCRYDPRLIVLVAGAAAPLDRASRRAGVQVTRRHCRTRHIEIPILLGTERQCPQNPRGPAGLQQGLGLG